MRRAGVIGGGAWGTALAQVCARAEVEVILQAREPEVVDAINASHENTTFLPDVKLNEAISATTDLADLADCDMVLAVAPAQHLRSVLEAFAPHARDGLPVLLCSKGIERGSLKLMTEVLAEALPQAMPAVLSGPSFAGEVARGLPTAVTLACPDQDLAMELAEAVATPSFRPYLAEDMIGAEIGGSIKNVLAISTGIVEGKELGRSAHAALITRGFSEMTKLAVALGAQAETVTGLCGLGDLVLTCSSPKSRNMSVGLALGGGQTIDEALAGKLTVAEGVASAPAIRELAARHGLDLPICEAVAAIIAGEMTVDAAIMDLLSRPIRAEAE